MSMSHGAVGPEKAEKAVFTHSDFFLMLKL